MEYMLPDNGTKCWPHFVTLSDHAASGLKNILAFAEEMKTETDTLPDDLKPFGEALADFTMQALIGSYIETLKLISDLRMQEIVQAAIPPNHQTEPDLLERSMSDAI
jgi:hypothetical protein